MSALRLPDIVKYINGEWWTGRGTLTIAVDGSRCRLVHEQTGKSVAFDLKRADLSESMDVFVHHVLSAPMATLKGII